MPRLILLTKSVAAFGFSLWVATVLAEPINDTEQENQLSAWIKWGNPPTMDEAWADHAAQYDFVAYAPGVWEGKSKARRMLRKRNPDIRIGTYFQMHTLPYWLQRSNPESYPGRLWAAGSPFLARTTTGDTAAIYRNYPVYDFTNPDARAAIIAELNRYVRANHLDWALLDYCPVAIPDHRQGWPGVEGDMDLNGNGVGYWDDDDEPAFAISAWYDYLEEMRAILPDGFLLIPNGNLAMRKDSFARLVDGCFVENFPHWFFGSQAPNYQNALDKNFPNSLHNLTAPHRWNREPGYVMLGNPQYQDWSALTNLFNGMVEVFDQTGDMPPPAPNQRGLGAPTEPLRQWALEDSLSGYFLGRDFEFGHVDISVMNNQMGADIEMEIE
jgi:hypothetical protein